MKNSINLFLFAAVLCSFTNVKAAPGSFGGMYQRSNLGCTQNNPYTGYASCPAGYSDSIVYGVMGQNTCNGANDQSWLHVCTRPGFGGAYQTSNLGCNKNNPVTGSTSCPAGTYDTIVYGAMGANTCTGANDQTWLHLCLKSGSGGAYQSSNLGCTKNNPMTGYASCPAGTYDSIVFGAMGLNTCTGTNDQTWLHICTR